MSTHVIVMEVTETQEVKGYNISSTIVRGIILEAEHRPMLVGAPEEIRFHHPTPPQTEDIKLRHGETYTVDKAAAANAKRSHHLKHLWAALNKNPTRRVICVELTDDARPNIVRVWAKP